jgi:hypothetical protein
LTLATLHESILIAFVAFLEIHLLNHGCGSFLRLFVGLKEAPFSPGLVKFVLRFSQLLEVVIFISVDICYTLYFTDPLSGISCVLIYGFFAVLEFSLEAFFDIGSSIANAKNNPENYSTFRVFGLYLLRVLTGILAVPSLFLLFNWYIGLMWLTIPIALIWRCFLKKDVYDEIPSKNGGEGVNTMHTDNASLLGKQIGQ